MTSSSDWHAAWLVAHSLINYLKCHLRCIALLRVLLCVQSLERKALAEILRHSLHGSLAEGHFFSFQIIIYNPLKKKECDFICHFYLHYNHMGAAARTMIPKLALAESPCQREWHEEGHRDDTESLWHCAGGTERDIHGSGLFLVAVAVAVLTVLGAEWKQGRWK